MHRIKKKWNILRILAVLMIASALLTVCVLPASAAEGGSCGDGLTWTLNAGTLTISGSGAMTDYKDRVPAPWYEFRENIIRLQIDSTVTSIGSFAFYGCKNLTSVQIPDSVKTIGRFAFTSCERLSSVQLGKGLTSIGESAFNSCYSLSSLRLPYSLTHLGAQAFYRCEALYTVCIPVNVQSMGNSVFAYCKNLIRAEIQAPLNQLPSWTFYGCSLLSEVALAETVRGIDNSAFKQCDELANIYFAGNEEQTEHLEQQIVADVPAFEVRGYISNGEISSTSTSGRYVENDDETVTQTDATVMQDDLITLVHTVDRTYQPFSEQKGTYTADISLTVEQNKAWEYAINQTKQTLAYITDTYANQADMAGTTMTLYMKNDTVVSEDFLNEMAGREIKLIVVSSNGSTWKLNCNDLQESDPNAGATTGKDYSHKIEEASPEACEKLGTDHCYKLIFTDSVEKNAEVLVQLPPQGAVQSNAYLYQVEPNGTYTRLQAVKVDNNGNAHFYVASVNKDVEYVIGLNVPGESTDDVIIPDELLVQFGSSLTRWEEIPYIHMGRVSSWGMKGSQVTWILIGVLLGTTVLVGGIMLMWHKKKNKKIVRVSSK